VTDTSSDAVVALATSAQRGLWLTHLLDESSTAYHVSHAFRVADDFDTDALARGLISLVDRHEALRTSFTHVDDELYQVIRPPGGGDKVLEHLQVDAGEPLVEAIQREFYRPFDIAGARLIRAGLIAHNDGPVFTLVAHHMIVDAQSIGILLDELPRLYEAERRGVDAGLPPSPLHPGDYADWEARFVATASYRRQVEFFRELLAGAPKAIDLPLPVRRSAPWRGGVASAVLSPAVTSVLIEAAAAAGTTSFVAFLTLYAGVLHRWSAQDVVVVGTPVSVRSEPGLERAVGMFVNSQPIPTRWADDPTFTEALGRVRDTVVECLARYQCPFDRMVADLKPTRMPGRAPIFQVMFGYYTDVAEPGGGCGPLAEEIPLPVETAKFELSLDVTVRGGGTRFDLEWSAERCTAEAAACLVDHLVLAASCVARDPSVRIGELPLGPETPAGPDLTDGDDLTAPFPPLPTAMPGAASPPDPNPATLMGSRSC